MKKHVHIKPLLLFSVLTLALVFIGITTNNLFGSTTDWLSQHTVFPSYFRDLFYETKRLVPNFALNIGAGQNIFYFSYYGLFNPYILLSYFVPFIDMVSYLIIINILIVIMSSFLFYEWLLKNQFEYRLALITSLIFLLINPLIFHAHRHFMFINYMPFLILALIGVDDYLTKGSRWLYTLSVFLMIMTSYYYCPGGILVILIYGVYKYITIHNRITFKRLLKDGIQFIKPIIIAFLMAGILLIPTLMAITSGRVSITNNFDLYSLLIPHFNIEALLYSPYSLGFTSVALIALIASLITSKKERLWLGITIIILIAIPFFAYFLNGTLYIRNKVFIPFAPLIGLLIILFLRDLKLNKLNLPKLLVMLIGLIIISFLTGYRNAIFYVDILVTLITLILCLYYQKLSCLYVILLVIASISSLIAGQSENYVSRDLYHTAFSKRDEQIIKKVIKQDQSFYRMNNLIGNTGITCNKIYDPRYYQTSLYSSTHNAYYQDFFNNIMLNAMPHRNSIIAAQTNNIMFQTLMGVKYILTDNNVPIGFVKIDSNNGVAIYKNDNVLPLGYASSSLVGQNTFAKLKYPYTVEALVNSVVVNQDIDQTLTSYLQPLLGSYEYVRGDSLTITKSNDTVIIDAKESDNILLSLDQPLNNKILFIRFNVVEAPSCNKGDISITINNITNKLTCRSWIYFNNNYGFEYVISSPGEIKDLNILFSKGHFVIEDINLYTLDYNYIKDINKRVDPLVIDLSDTKGDKITGHIKVTKDGYLATTIPYDKGFTILVNGKPIKYEKVNKAFLGFPIKRGNYKIEIIYKAPGINLGIIMSLLGFLLFISIIITDKRKKV
ncbi:MAG: YfhO family protein [Bacilli bacterium]